MATASFRFPLQAQQFELRPYQTEAVQDIRSSVGAGNKRVLLQASTGSGKTIIAADIMQRAAEKSSRVLFLAHRRELIDQCSDKLWRFGVRHGIIMAGRRLDLVERVQVASVQTLTSRAIRREVMELPPTDLIVIDEAHRSASDSYREIVERYPTAVLLGLTATPCRTDGKGLGHIYQDLICCPSMAELTEQGYLVPVRYFAPTAPYLEGVEVRAGDYVEKQLAERMDKAKLVGDVVEHWQKFGEDRQTIVFATNVRHSQHLAEKFQQAGVQAAHLDGKTEKPEREHLLADLGQGRLRVLCNCEVLTEGWDSPTVSCCVLAKPTKSLGRYLQMAGRVLRPAEGKTDCLLIDHAGAVLEHGFLDDPIPWSLDEDDKVQERREKERKKGERLPIICEECFTIYSGRKDCPRCGKEAPKPPPIEHTEGELGEIKCREAGLSNEQIKIYRELKGFAQDRGHHWMWVEHSFCDWFTSEFPQALRRLPAMKPGKAVRDWAHQRLKEYAKKKAAEGNRETEHSKRITVAKFWPIGNGRKDHTCLLCKGLIRKGNVHYDVSLRDETSQYPVKRKCCYGCWNAGRLSKGLEVTA